MIKIDGKIYRNLEEQVRKNQHDVEDIFIEQKMLAAMGIRIVGRGVNEAALPDPATYTGEFGDAYQIGTGSPYDYFIYTRPLDGGPDSPFWFPLGKFPLAGPQGATGLQGPAGPDGQSSTIYVGEEPGGAREGDKLIRSDGYIYSYEDIDGTLTWLNTYVNIRGPRGPQGIQGIRGPQGLQGIQGPAGPQGEQGGLIRIVGIVSSSALLPTPSSIAALDVAYLVGESDPYDLYIQIGETPSSAVWTDVGQFNSATVVMASGVGQSVWNADSKVDKLTTVDAYTYVYTFSSGGQSYQLYASSALANSLALRDGNGCVKTATPLSNEDSATKKYVDDANTLLAAEVALKASTEDLQNGIIVPERAKNADNLTPYSADSGVSQDTPFSFQGTGCGNGTAQVDTGSYGIIKNKRGFGLNVNQLIGALTPTSINDLTVSFVNGVITVSGTASANTNLKLADSFVKGHKLLITNLPSGGSSSTYGGYFATSGDWVLSDSIVTFSNQGSFNIRVVSGQTVNISCKPQLVDLTRMFGGTDLIPADLLAHPENFYRYYSGSLAYRTGGMLFSQARYLKTYGRNQWDEQWESGLINASTGEKQANASYIRSKNYIRAIPNQQYYIHLGSSGYYGTRLYCYDSNYNYIGYTDATFYATPTPVRTLPQTCYVMFFVTGASYNNDITISLYYSGESGYTEYYPYEELANIDTGAETLLAAREAYDSKAPDGTITQRIQVINLDDLTWELVEGEGYWYFASLYDTSAASPGSDVVPNAVADNYLAVKMNDAGLADNTVAVDGNGVVIRTDNTSNEPSGYLWVEKATYTTEAGSSFPESCAINDFGSMSFESANGIPQGVEIFYPVDLKAFLDSAYIRTDGDATNLVIQSELDAEDDKVGELYAIYMANMGGALRHQLVANTSGLDFLNTGWMDLGELTYTYSNYYFTATLNGVALPANATTVGNVICSLYKNRIASGFAGNSVDGEMCITPEGAINIKNTSYTDATAFKKAMKGVLLAYEKA